MSQEAEDILRPHKQFLGVIFTNAAAETENFLDKINCCNKAPSICSHSPSACLRKPHLALAFYVIPLVVDIVDVVDVIGTVDGVDVVSVEV